MSKIKLTGENSGYVEISAGQNAGNNTLQTPTSGTRLVAHEGSQDVTLNANLTVNGVLTYDDVTNIDSVGVITARAGVNVTGGSVGIGTDAPATGNKLHLHDTSACRIQLTTDSTGHTSSDGTRLMVDSSNNFEILNRENANIEFFTNNTERLRITSAGDVGIGYNNPTVKLHIREAASGVSSYDNRYHCIIEDDAEAYYGVYVPNTGYGGLRVIDGSGNIGSRLDYYVNENQMHYQCVGDHIFSTSNNAERLRITNAGDLFVAGTGGMNTTQLPNGSTINVNGTSSNDGLSVIRYSTGYGAYGLNIGRSKSNTLGTNAAVTNGNDLGHITFYGADGTDFNQAAQITAQVDGTPSDGTDMPGRLVFKTSSDGSATPTERLRIDSNGSALLTTDGQSDQYSYAMKLGQGAYMNSGTTSPHYGLWVRQLGPRYGQNFGIYSEVEDDAGMFGGATLDGLSSVSGIGVFGGSPISASAYQKAIGVYGKATNADYNYNSAIGVRGRVETGTTSFINNNGQKSYGGHFVATGKSDVVGVYADAYLAGSPGANQVAIPLLVSSNGSEKLRITSDGLLVGKGAQFTANITPTSGRGVEIFEASAGVGLIQSYNRTGTSFDELRLRGSEVRLYANTNLRLDIQNAQSYLYGTSDGVLNISTTDSRGSFIRYQLNGSTKTWAGCSQGLGTGGNSDDFGIRATRDIRFRAGTQTNMRLTAAGYLQVASDSDVTGDNEHIFRQHQNTYNVLQLRAETSSYAAGGGGALAIGVIRSASSSFTFGGWYSGNNSSNFQDKKFNFRGDGNAYADGSWNGGGADYAEYFEWSDGNTSSEDRRGISVVLDGDKIREATSGEDPIGVISANPSVVGDADDLQWKNKYLRTEYGSFDLDENGEQKLNPDYNSEQEYVSRENRPEWDIVGLMGKLRIRKGQVTGSRWIKMRDVSANVEEWLVR